MMKGMQDISKNIIHRGKRLENYCPINWETRMKKGATMALVMKERRSMVRLSSQIQGLRIGLMSSRVISRVIHGLPCLISLKNTERNLKCRVNQMLYGMIIMQSTRSE